MRFQQLFSLPQAVRSLRAAGWLTLLGLSTSACVENQSSVYIHQVMAQLGDCAVTWSPDEAALGSGIMDLAVTRSYSAALLIGNQLQPLGNNVSLRAETSRLRIQNVQVRVMNGDLSQELIAYRSAVSATISPDRSENPGFGGVFVDIIPESNELQLEEGKLYIAIVSVEGETLGGTKVKSGEFQFPINTCYGCTVRSSLTLDPTGALVCDPSIEVEEPACHPGQGPTSCQFCREQNCQSKGN